MTGQTGQQNGQHNRRFTEADMHRWRVEFEPPWTTIHNFWRFCTSCWKKLDRFPSVAAS